MGKFKKVASLALSIALLSSFAGCKMFEEKVVDVDESKTTLYVSTRDSGFRDNWLNALARGFEKKYENVSFEDGKLGVQVIDEAARNNTGGELRGTIGNSSTNVFMVEAMNYTDYIGANLLYNLTDTVKSELDDGSGTIVSKLDENSIEYLTAVDGNYYALPWLVGFQGLTYDAKLFEEENLFFADENGTKPFGNSSYTGKAYTGRGFVSAQNTKKTCGPDGEYNTFDDGLPSSYEELFYLLDQMYAKGIDGLIYTGSHPTYLNYLFQGLFLAYSGKEQTGYTISFDSGEKTSRIITSFDADGNPVVENIKITQDNGYLTAQSEGIYYALKFLEYLHKNESKYFYAGSSGAFGNIDAQSVYIESYFNPAYKPIGMLIEGSYWVNEAEVAFNDTANTYIGADKRDFKFMSLPIQELGTVTEGNGRKATVADGFYNYFVVNGNIKNDPVKVDLTTKFIKYCYEDASLQNSTMLSGSPVGVDYELEETQYNSMDTYKKSLWDIYSVGRQNKTYLTPVSGSKIFYNNYNTFAISKDSTYFNTTINGINYQYPRLVFNLAQNNTARDYFNGMKISQTEWNSYKN